MAKTSNPKPQRGQNLDPYPGKGSEPRALSPKATKTSNLLGHLLKLKPSALPSNLYPKAEALLISTAKFWLTVYRTCQQEAPPMVSSLGASSATHMNCVPNTTIVFTNPYPPTSV